MSTKDWWSPAHSINFAWEKFDTRHSKDWGRVFYLSPCLIKKSCVPRTSDHTAMVFVPATQKFGETLSATPDLKSYVSGAINCARDLRVRGARKRKFSERRKNRYNHRAPVCVIRRMIIVESACKWPPWQRTPIESALKKTDKRACEVKK